MAPALGEKLGEGYAAEVYGWGPGTAIKLFRPVIPRRVGEYEARVTQAVCAAGGPAPEVLDEVVVDGRFGLVLPRLDGPSLGAAMRGGAVTREAAGEMLAELLCAVHATRAPPETPDVRRWFEGAARTGRAPPDVIDRVRRHVADLGEAEGLCHGDLHLGNVVLTAEGPRIIDWIGAVRASPALDLGRLQLLTTELVAEGIDPARPAALNARLQAAYSARTGLTSAAMASGIAAHLPVLRAFALAELAWTPAQRRGLETRLRPAEDWC